MERAFKLSHDCDLYKKYFKSHEEKQKSHQLARAFFDENGLIDDELKSQYILSERLTLTLTKEQRVQFEKDLMTDTIEGLYRFKKSSQLQKKWFNEVYNNVDSKALDACRFWAYDCIMRGSSSLWHNGEDVYGVLESESEFKLPIGAEELKLSEYYKIVEAVEEKIKANKSK